MKSPNISHEDVARVAHAIWDSDGRPEGRDHEHWMQAKRLLEEGRAGELFPEAAPETDPTARSVQPGFKDARPGIVPEMKEDPGPELREEPGGRFAKQLAGLPETREDDAARPGPPGPRDPAPVPPTRPDGYVSVPSVEDRAGGALSDDPAPPDAARVLPKGRRKVGGA